MSGSAIEPFDVRAYYQRITSQDIGEVAREILGGYIKDEQGSTIFVDCPRHKSESHRSFHIWIDKQGWYCHGCGKGGDILQLVEFIQSGEITTGKIGVMPVTHRNARDFLATRIGLSSLSQVGLSPEETKKVEAARALTLRAWECLTAISGFYKEWLLNKTDVLDWLKEKYALDAAAVETFQIGYADNEGLIDHLFKSGFTLREMTATGAFRPSSQHEEVVYPTFEKRIIFPYLSKGQTVFMIARKTPWTPDNKYESGKYKKLPVHDSQKRRYIAPGIDNSTLYNEDILTSRPDRVIITEGITDCISLIQQGFSAISPVTVNIRTHDWDRIIPKLRGIGKIILCQDNEISQVGWKGALRSANRLSKEKIICLVTQLPLGKEQETAREKLQSYGITSGISSKELKKIQEEKSLRECNEIQALLEQAKIDVCSFFVSGKTADDFQTVIDAALLPIDYAIQEIPENADQSIIDHILVEIGKQSKTESTRLIKKLQPKTGANLTELRAAVKDAVSADNHRQYEELKSQTERKLGKPVFQRGNRSFYLIDNGILEQSVKETPNGPYLESKEIANFHIKIDKEEISDDGEFHDDGSTAFQKILSGKIIGNDWENHFKIGADEWGNNNKLSCKITNQAGTRALFSNKDMDMIRMFCASYSGSPEEEIVYAFFGVHPTAGFVTPSVTIYQGKISNTSENAARVNVGCDYGKAARLDLARASQEEVREIIGHLLSDYLDLQPREITMPILAHAFLGPLLFDMDLVGEFPPYVLFVAGPSGKGKTETAKFAQSIWGNFQIKEHLASWGSTPEANRQEAARCRGALWVIDDFKRAKIGKSQWGNAIRVLMDYADLQARKRATPGAKLITNYPMKCMLLITGEDVSIAETALQARSLVVDFNGHKDMESFRKCMKRQQDYRKIPPHYIAWLQKQENDKWLTIIRQYLDEFLVYVDSIGMDTDNSRRLASNTALSMAGMKAFLDFSVSIGAIDQDYADSLLKIHHCILQSMLSRMLVDVEEIKPANLFISTLEEIIRSKRARVLEVFSDNSVGTPIIGYYKNNKKYVCLFPRIAMGLVQETFKKSEDESINFSSTAIARQLVEDGFMEKPQTGNQYTYKERIPGAGKKISPVRIWKLYANKLNLEEDN